MTERRYEPVRPPTDRDEWRWRTYPLAIIGAVFLGVVLVAVTSDGSATLTGRLGGDFPEFFAAGRIVADGDGALLYDIARQIEAQAAYWGEEGGAILFAYPPVVALFYLPLALIDYRLAYLGHTVLMVGALFLAVRLLTPFLPVLQVARYRWAAVAFSLTFLPMFTGTIMGQNTALTLLAIAAIWWGLDRGRDVLAGVAAGLLMVKPQYGVPILGLIFLARRWSAFGVAVVTTAALWAVSTLVSGIGWTRSWFDIIRSLSDVDGGANLHNEVSWLGLSEVVFGAGSTVALAIGVGLAAVTVVLLLWRLASRPVLDRYTVALIMPTLLLIAPHSLYYDAGLLLVSLGALLFTIAPHRRRLVLTGWWLIGLAHVAASDLGVEPVAALVIITWIWAFRSIATADAPHEMETAP